MSDTTSMASLADRPLVSVCVPVYNVAPYIEQCARTLFEQSYPAIEFVFVDDASTDDSMTILRRVAADYPNAQVSYLCNDHNRGLAYTRRCSIEAATGEYICCVDSDDWVERNMIERLVDAALTTHAMMVECGFVRHRGTDVENIYPIRVDSFDDVLRDLPRNNIWGKLYHRSLFADMSVFAPEGLDFMEDRHVLTRLRYTENPSLLPSECLYHYRASRPGSVATMRNDKHFRCTIVFYRELESWLQQHGVYETYRATVVENKTFAKAFLMRYCYDNQVCRQYASLYREVTPLYRSTLSRGYRVVLYLAEAGCWHTLSLFRHASDRLCSTLFNRVRS